MGAKKWSQTKLGGGGIFPALIRSWFVKVQLLGWSIRNCFSRLTVFLFLILFAKDQPHFQMQLLLLKISVFTNLFQIAGFLPSSWCFPRAVFLGEGGRGGCQRRLASKHLTHRGVASLMGGGKKPGSVSAIFSDGLFGVHHVHLVKRLLPREQPPSEAILKAVFFPRFAYCKHCMWAPQGTLHLGNLCSLLLDT